MPRFLGESADLGRNKLGSPQIWRSWNASLNPVRDPGIPARIRPSRTASLDPGLDLEKSEKFLWIPAELAGFWPRSVHPGGDLRILGRVWGCQRNSRDSGENLWIPTEIRSSCSKSLDSSRDRLIPAEVSGFWPGSGDVEKISLDSGRDPGILAEICLFRLRRADSGQRGVSREPPERCRGLGRGRPRIPASLGSGLRGPPRRCRGWRDDRRASSGGAPRGPDRRGG